MAEQTEADQFSDTPTGWASRLTAEFDAAKKALKGWHDEANKALDAFLDERATADTGDTRLNIYTSDTQTQEAMLYGKTPKVSVSRRFSDAQDDVARVASEIQERILNSDIEADDDTFAQALEYALSDRQHTAFGLARVRYERGEPQMREAVPAIPGPVGPDGMPTELAAAVPAVQTFPDERVETDYTHWQDVLWGPCRVWHEVPWVAFRSELSQSEKVRKFGEKVAALLPVKSKKPSGGDKEGKAADPWGRTDVWEVWVRDGRQVFFFVEGYSSVIAPEGVAVQPNGAVADPLGLVGFFPCPRPMMANWTTRKLVPRPDYMIAKDLFEGINNLATRIKMLKDAVRVVGAYDKGNKALAGMLNGKDNTMIPVDSWAMFAEKGGVKGAVDWFPLDQVVGALTVLRECLTEEIDHARQITGMSDIMRGQASEAGTTATSDRITARFGSVRMQKRQQELARFATDLQKLRAEVMAKHFDESTYLARCNCENTNDKALAPEAVKLIKADFSKYRIEVKPENISMTDFDALKQERTEVITAIAQYMQAVAPIAEAMPGAMPHLLQILQWMVAGIRGGSDIESVLDQAIAQAKTAAEQPQQQPQDPKIAQLQLKAQTDMAKEDKKLEHDLVRTQADVMAETAKQEAQAKFNIEEHKAKVAATPPKMAPGGAPR